MIVLWLYLIIVTMICADVFIILFRVERKEDEENGRTNNEIL